MSERKTSKELETRRLKRNEYSRNYKKAHPTKVRARNKAWHLEQAGNKEAADELRASVRGPKGNGINTPKAEETTIDVKQVVTVAAEYLRSLLGEIGVLRLEEVEKKNNDRGWLVTLRNRF